MRSAAAARGARRASRRSPAPAARRDHERLHQQQVVQRLRHFGGGTAAIVSPPVSTSRAAKTRYCRPEEPTDPTVNSLPHRHVGGSLGGGRGALAEGDEDVAQAPCRRRRGARRRCPAGALRAGPPGAAPRGPPGAPPGPGDTTGGPKVPGSRPSAAARRAEVLPERSLSGVTELGVQDRDRDAGLLVEAALQERALLGVGDGGQRQQPSARQHQHAGEHAGAQRGHQARGACSA